jgi:SCY1-like protein 2
MSWRLLGSCTYPSLAVVTLVNVSNNAPNATDSGVLGGWWFGASPSSPDSNFLRVHNAFPNRRLSDNALMMPPKIRIAPSCASSPGGTPGGGGLPIRRHSSIGPQERRGSTVNLSPPTVSMILLYQSLFCLGT